MSYILEALKKAEQQREIGQVPGIDSTHESASAGMSSRWVVIVVLVLLVNAGLLVVLFWPDGRAEVPRSIADSQALPPAADSTPPISVQPAPVISPAPVLLPATVATAPVQAIPEPIPATPPAPRDYVRDLPVWPQVPAHIFQKLQSGLRLDVHVYSDRPQDRFVLINLQKYREGERLQEGPVLDEITAEGIVLSLQGQQFLVQAK
ncbi:hypothetical protein MNBD_GAMMA15-584 [hydrothermal vent metagenome]|uniref:Type II secretion system protein GspB C-terminal domain-containing protein n=1 Tax=hydrothermal vent metagenome TaxID=652676 RepID=A0A3B0YR03_9ZZZZ